MKQNNTTVNILFCGTGGQGVLKAAEVCGLAAIIDGYHTKKSEIHGMAQRGGSVESHLRFGAEVFSPLIPKGDVDFLVSFHQKEHERMSSFLRPQGVDLIDSFKEAVNILSDKRFLNTYLLGKLSIYLPIQEESWLQAIATAFAAKYLDKNKEVFLSARK
jgi:indolepyruvate ferredoxin oxidoreductase beta subunit